MNATALSRTYHAQTIPRTTGTPSSFKVAVFFIDDHQAVRADEVGSTLLLREAAVGTTLDSRRSTCKLNSDAPAQTSISTGSINCSRSGRRASQVRVAELRRPIVRRSNRTRGRDDARVRACDNARLTTGFCWPWSMPNADGALVDYVRIGSFRRLWNAKPEARKLPKAVPRRSGRFVFPLRSYPFGYRSNVPEIVGI